MTHFTRIEPAYGLCSAEPFAGSPSGFLTCWPTLLLLPGLCQVIHTISHCRCGKGETDLAALDAAQVLQLEGARFQAHCPHQLRLYGGQVVAIAAVLAGPLVRLRMCGLTRSQRTLCALVCRPSIVGQPQLLRQVSKVTEWIA